MEYYIEAKKKNLTNLLIATWSPHNTSLHTSVKTEWDISRNKK